jgi:hypothetical protein
MGRTRSWTRAVGWALRARVAARAQKLRDERFWTTSTARIQGETLRSLLRRAARTEIGREHGFARIARIDDHAERLAAYRATVPVTDWYGISDRVARMREQAEPDVLWPGLVKRFAQTSGTTAGDKFIPVTDEMMRSNYLSSLDIFAHLINRGLSLGEIMTGRCLFLGGCSDLKPDEHGIITADLSGLVTPLIRWPLTAIYSPGPDIALLSDWTEKIERMAALTSRQDIRMISGMPSWASVLMQRVLEVTGKPTINRVWPNLSVFVHGGVRYGPFKPRIGALVTGSPDGDIPHRHELYPASEAFIAMQDRADSPSLRLMSDNDNVYEFVPLEHVADDGSIPADAPACTPDAAEPGVRYAVVLTTCAGLFRYNIGDAVEFDDIPASLDGARPGTGPARLRIVGRHRHFINAFGENLIVEHIERAVEAAAAQTGLPTGEFTASPVYPGPTTSAGLELAIELDTTAVGTGALSRFRDAFDASLKAQNVDYTTKRGDDLGMVPPTVSPVPPGTFHRWMQSRGKLGGQNKCPRCANHRDFIDGVLAAAQPAHT